MKFSSRIFSLGLISLLGGCADEGLFLSGYIKRASAGLMTPCDPYNRGQNHTCVVYAPVFGKHLIIYDATAEAMVWSPVGFPPLKVKEGQVTTVLARVASPNPKFPYILSLDATTKQLFAVHTFPQASKQSFSEPTPQMMPNASFAMAAYEDKGQVTALLLNKTSIDFLTLDTEGKIVPSSTTKLDVGTALSDIKIDVNSQRAFVSDSASKIHILSLSNPKNPQATTVSISQPVDKLALSVRDFGLGEKPYLAGIGISGKKLVLMEANAAANLGVTAEISLEETPTAIYFPDKSSEPCCGGKKNWLQISTIKGKILFFAINNTAQKLSLSLEKTVDLTSKQVLGMSRIHIAAMVGGKVEVDPSLKREITCPNNRKTFFVSSYASEDALLGYNGYEQMERDGQYDTCEGGVGARRMDEQR